MSTGTIALVRDSGLDEGRARAKEGRVEPRRRPRRVPDGPKDRQFSASSVTFDVKVHQIRPDPSGDVQVLPGGQFDGFIAQAKP